MVILVAIILMVIDGYINGYWCLYTNGYWCLYTNGYFGGYILMAILVAIILMAILVAIY
jgi:hypothetical protein